MCFVISVYSSGKSCCRLLRRLEVVRRSVAFRQTSLTYLWPGARCYDRIPKYCSLEKRVELILGGGEPLSANINSRSQQYLSLRAATGRLMSNMDLMSASVQQLEPLRPSSTSPVKDDVSWKEEVEERAQRGIECTNLCVF